MVVDVVVEVDVVVVVLTGFRLVVVVAFTVVVVDTVTRVLLCWAEPTSTISTLSEPPRHPQNKTKAIIAHISLIGYTLRVLAYIWPGLFFTR